jgi:polar amino acid transport system substrate-binding protein
MTTRTPRLLLTIVFLLVSATVITANDGRMLVVTERWPPFRVEDPQSRHGFTGIDIDILILMEEELGLTIEVQRHPFARCLEMIRSGRADLITGIAYTEERAAFIAYIPTSYWSVRPVFYTQAGRGHEITAYEDLYDCSIGYSLDSAYFEPFNSDPGLDKVGVSTEQQLLEMLALGRIDVTIGTEPNIGYDIAVAGLRDSLEPTAYAPEIETPLYFGLSPVSPFIDLADEIEAFLQRLVAGSELDRIGERYR